MTTTPEGINIDKSALQSVRVDIGSKEGKDPPYIPEHVEDLVSETEDLVYDVNDQEPELHARTYIALIATALVFAK